MMTPASHVEMTERELDAIAWEFLGSEFAEPIYANWPIDRRVDAHLLQHGLIEIVNDGGTYEALLDSVMANIGAALRSGVLNSPKTVGP